MRTVPRLLALAAILTAPAAAPTLASCGDDASPASDALDATGGDTTGADTRPAGRPLLGARAEGYDPSAPVPRPWVASLDGTPADLAEVLVIPLDVYGIPWSSFSGPDNQPTDLPGPWVAAVNALKALAAQRGLPIVLALSPLSPAWDTLAPEAREENGTLVLNTAWRVNCYNPATDGNPTKWRDAYAGFAVWAVKQFNPRWVVLASRVNRYEENCGVAPYTALLDYPAEADRRLKAQKDFTPPATIVGVDVEDLYGYPQKPGRCVAITPEACLAQRAPLLDAITADLLGLESYPAFALDDLATLPTTWLSAVADLRADLPATLLGTSLPAVALSRRTTVCGPLFDGSEALQSQWLDRALATAQARAMPFIIWRSLTDLLPTDVVTSCPCAGDATLCQHLDGLGGNADDVRRLTAAGLIDSAGTERPALSLWRQTLTAD